MSAVRIFVSAPDAQQAVRDAGLLPEQWGAGPPLRRGALYVTYSRVRYVSRRVAQYRRRPWCVRLCGGGIEHPRLSWHATPAAAVAAAKRYVREGAL